MLTLNNEMAYAHFCAKMSCASSLILFLRVTVKMLKIPIST